MAKLAAVNSGSGPQGPAAAPLALLAAIVEASDDAIVSKDLNGIVTSWNEGAEMLFGYSAAEMIGCPILKLIPRELHSEETHILAQIRAGERVDHFESERLRKDGRRIPVSLTISPVRDEWGHVIGASKIARDLTAKRDAERHAAILAAIVRSSDDAIISKDLNGIVTSWNPAAERLYGFGAEEMIGEPILRLIPPELGNEEDRILAKIRAGEGIDHYETLRMTKGGERIHVSLTVSPIRNAAGRIVGASKIARDITAQREAQRRKDQFLAVLAHELRNPLAPIRNAIALFGAPAASAELRERAREIAERQMEHMTRLIEDLLDVSRLSTGKVELRKALVELAPMVEHVTHSMAAEIEAKGHAFQSRQAPERMWLFADAARISQVLHNLLSNAIKYTEPGGRIEISTAREEGFAVIRVKDNGMGISQAMKRQMFTLFTQDIEAVRRAAGGLGIGLALVKEFVERHAGTVTAYSDGPNKGAEFVVRLPLAEGPPSP